MSTSRAQSTVRSEQTISEAVIAAVSAVSGRDPLPVDAPGDAGRERLEPLYEAIDPDALNALFQTTDRNERSQIAVTFTYCGYTVSVESDGTVTVDGDEPDRTRNPRNDVDERTRESIVDES